MTSGPSLSDYANVIVVDAGGNGDYTTLEAANSVAVANDVIWIFGAVTVSNARVSLKNGASIYLAPGASIVMDDAELYVLTGQSFSIFGSGRITGTNLSHDDFALVFVRGNLTLDGITVHNTGAGYALQSRSTTTNITARTCKLLANNAAALYFPTVPTVSLYTHCYIQSAVSDNSFTNAPFYFCVFDNVTNITAASGTPNGSNVVI